VTSELAASNKVELHLAITHTAYILPPLEPLLFFRLRLFEDEEITMFLIFTLSQPQYDYR